jgi:WD40 repeat protein
MRRVLRLAPLALAAATLSSSGCARNDAGAAADSSERALRDARFEARRQGLDSTASPNDPLARWILPDDLREVSGLALLPDGRVVAHGDERGRVYLLDPRRGTLLKQFDIGKVGDFEGATMVGDSIVLLASNGELYIFAEGANDATVPYRKWDTRLGKECEFEGIAYEARTQSYVLACKNVMTKELKNHLVLYRWNPDGAGVSQVSTIAIPLGDSDGTLPWKSLNPSDLAIDPANGNLVIVAGQEKAIIVLSPDGRVISTDQLPKGHPQSEGIAVTRDSVLILSDEARGGPPTITLYRWQPAARPE